jgi:hypothetical protein
VAHGGVAHGAPQNALYGFDVVLPIKSLQLLMFQGRGGITTGRTRGGAWRMRSGAPVRHDANRP